MNIHKSPQQIWIERLVIYIPVLTLAAFMVIPYYWMVIGAFKPVAELKKVPPTLTIENPTTYNFYDPAFEESTFSDPNRVEGLFQRYPNTRFGFMRYYGNSTLVAVTNTLFGLVVASLSAYVLAKHKFLGREILFYIILGSMMIPWQVRIIPQFIIISELKWIDSFWALIIPAIPRAYTLFFLRQSMLSIPDELVEAARIDGASEFRIWWQIVSPLVVPAMVAMGLFIFLSEWNNLVWPLVVLQSEEMRTLPIVLATMVDPYSAALDQGVAMAAALLVSLPTLVLFLMFQRQFVRGIAFSGLKG